MQSVLPLSRLADMAPSLPPAVTDYIRAGQTETYESFDRHILIAFDRYDLDDTEAKPPRVLLYLDRDNLFCFAGTERAAAELAALFPQGLSNEEALHRFFAALLKGANRHLEKLDETVSLLDDDVADGTEEGLREALIDARNSILHAKAYFDQMEFLFECITENDNGLISESAMKYLRILHSRTVRLAQKSQDLKEYITQVRDSYRAQIGIEQNELMKVFTFVTSIFLPLSLIAGWYGMNLKMPEFAWDYGYPFVIGLCTLVCLGWYLYFKRKKWF